MHRWPPEPPVPLPPGCVVHVPGRGEMFLRDSGGEGPPVLLLHGWMFSADLNWYCAYEPLAEAGYRVLAVDHRGHGRGLRTAEPFTLKACADDAAALLAHLKIQPVMAVGYSMGGPIASLLARDHPQLVAGVVLGATAMDWSGRRMRTFWRTMAGLRLALGLAPEKLWQRGLRAAGFPPSAITTWTAAELSPRQLRRHRRGRPRARPLQLAQLDRRPRRARRGDRDHRGHRRAPAQAARARRRDARPGVRGPRRPRRGDRARDEFNAQLLAALDAVRDPRAAAAS